MEELAVIAASLCIGLSLGFIGAGGSILTIPVFVYILKKDPFSSGVYSMFVVGMSAMAGSIQSMLNKLVDFKIMLTFGAPSVVGVIIARKIIFPFIPNQLFVVGSFVLSKEILFMLFLSSLMFLSAIRMLHPSTAGNNSREIDKPSALLLLPRGLVVGVITGLVGIGGGFLIVPALHFLARLPMKKAIGTALFIITANSLISFLSSFESTDLDWILLAKFSMGAIIGILAGAKLSQKVKGDYLKRIFGWFVLCTSFYVIYKQF